MKLYSLNDMRDFHFLTDKYFEMTDVAEKALKKSGSADSIEVKFALTSVKLAKDMMDNLGIEVPDDKAKELGFAEA